MTIYIAGKVSGLDPDEVTEKFATAQVLVERHGHTAINPITEVGNPQAEWTSAMRTCIASLMRADAIMLLPCFSDSPGALLEYKLATRLAMPMYNHKLIPISPFPVINSIA